jgi:hypothetical protein
MTRSADISFNVARFAKRMLDDVDDARRSGEITSEDADRFTVACADLLHHVPSIYSPQKHGAEFLVVGACSRQSAARSYEQLLRFDIFKEPDPPGLIFVAHHGGVGYRLQDHYRSIFERWSSIDPSTGASAPSGRDTVRIGAVELDDGSNRDPGAAQSDPQGTGNADTEDMARIRARTGELRRQFARDRERLHELVGRPD